MNVAVVSARVLIRKAICSLLVATGSFASVVDLDNILNAADLNLESKPRIIVVHTITHSSAIEAAHQSRELLPEARVILLSDEKPQDEFYVQALEAGAWGCLSTADTPQHLVRALMKVAEGERWVPQRVTNLIIEKFVCCGPRCKESDQTLTRREWEVLALLANGYRDKEIATELFISSETAKSHVKAIYRKLQVRGRSGAGVYYFKHFHSQGAEQEDWESKAIIFSA